MRRFSMRTHLSHALHTFITCVCLEANLVPSNLTLFLTVHFHAVHGYAATHMCTPHVYASHPFCHHHAVASCCSYLDMPFSVSVNRFGTNIYIQYGNTVAQTTVSMFAYFALNLILCDRTLTPSKSRSVWDIVLTHGFLAIQESEDLVKIWLNGSHTKMITHWDSFLTFHFCYSPTSGTTHLTDLVNFSLSSYLIISDFKPWGDSLQELTYLTPFTVSQTCVCLMVNLVLLNLNFILDSSFPCCAWLCCHTHAHYTCSMLLFHSATTMQLHHVINLRYACPKQYW